MNNVINIVKRFLSNRNTIIIIGAIAGVLLIYVGYNWSVKKATEMIQVPIAKTALTARHQITVDDFLFVDVPANLAKKQNLVKDSLGLVGMYVADGVTISANSFFFSQTVVTKSEQQKSPWSNIPDGYTLISLQVNLSTTYGNSIYPGNYIDLYFKGLDEDRKILFGKLIESIKVIAVHDNKGKNVFEYASDNRTPTYLYFTVPNDMKSLVEKAKAISGNNIEIIPVPRNGSYSKNPGETKIASKWLEAYIIAQSLVIDTDPNSNNSNNNNNFES